MQKAVPYYRVSTVRQGKSGLGLEAQRKAVSDHAARFQLTLEKEFIEVESTRKHQRLVLSQALKECKAKKAILLIATLDRLARNVFFISQLMESKIPFCLVDNPTASRLMLHILAAFAEHERDQISQRTKDALQATKLRGTLLGEYGRKVLSVENRDKADAFALKMVPIVEKLQANHHLTIRDLTKELNRKRIKTYSGGNAKWHSRTVHSMVKRIEKLNSEQQILN